MSTNALALNHLPNLNPNNNQNQNQHLWLNLVFKLALFSLSVLQTIFTCYVFIWVNSKFYCQWLYRLLTCQSVYWYVLILMFVWPSTLKGAEGGSFKSLPWTISVPPWTFFHPKFSMGRWCSPAGNHLPKPFSNKWCQSGPQRFQTKPSCATWQLETLPQTIRAQHAQKTIRASVYRPVSVLNFSDVFAESRVSVMSALVLVCFCFWGFWFVV